MGIAHELITRGWHQGSHEAVDGSVCIEAAACYAVGGRIVGEKPVFQGEAAADEFQRVLWIICGVKCLRGPTSCWNDDPDTTFDDVLRVAKEADEALGW